MEFTGKLKGKIAVVAGATRGAGRGIACMLGEAGATVYCTGRSVRGRSATKSRTETIEETAEMVSALGGIGIHVQVDHTDAAQVKALFERVEKEQGRLDLLVNDLTGDAHIEMKPFIEHSLERGLKVLENGSLSHIITSHFAVPLMIQTPGGLIIEMTDGVGDELREWNFYYDLEKAFNIRLARSLAAATTQAADRRGGVDAGIHALRRGAGCARRDRSELARWDQEGQGFRLLGDAVLRRQGGGGAGLR